MPSHNVSGLVDLFLPIDPFKVETADPDPALIAASLGSFSAAVFHKVTPMDAAERNAFCRRVAAQSQGDVPAWMVEACLRSVEGDRTAMNGTDPAVTMGIPIYGLVVLSNDYLAPDEALALRGRAVELALELLPKLEALPDE